MKKETIKNGARILLGGALIFAGVGHLSFARKEFQAQVPNWVPLKKDDTVIYSGLAEIALGAALIIAPKKHRETVGQVAAGFFTAVFPGNMAQYKHHRDAFGLNSGNSRLLRLAFQPILIIWALKSTQRNH
ncbi:DoxX family protein [Mucilaginibacter aquaedulcis]|uniref:DoxX family protein n=1 Tax=Mucilaginibacter aquaedulcis TaxID=1187081 RepID=UPI0025B4F469|nr:hypothetical protein [Mucilaginibacter aquaedulcis]MDN3548182.1 hypothetical protein [Mucilaginibacter aquaedulcis]